MIYGLRHVKLLGNLLQDLGQFVLCLLQVLTRTHAADEITRLSILMTIDLKQILLSDLGREDLAKCSLATTSVTNKKDWLTVTKAFINQDGEALQLL